MFFSISQIQALLYSKKCTIKNVVEFYLGNIKSNMHLNAFLEVFENEAFERASKIQEKINNRSAGRLAGLIIGIKDNISFKNHKLSASSKMLENFISLYNSDVIERLLEEDAIIIGRLNCDEFAIGSSNIKSAFGKVLNPLDNTKVPGGSSGGPSAAVAANMCLATLGSDTGGSIRQPASYTGLFAIKPTYGRVSRCGLVSYASSLDQIGVISKNIDDNAIILEIIAGFSKNDTTSSAIPVGKYSKLSQFKEKVKIAYFEEALAHPKLDYEIKDKTFEIIQKLKNNGHIVDSLRFEYIDYLVPCYYVLTNAEASSNLSRYDGIKYGYQSDFTNDYKSQITKSRTESFGSEVKQRIIAGTYILSKSENLYIKAQKLRHLIFDKTKNILKEYSFIILPTTPTTAFGFDENCRDATSMYLEDIFSVQANLSGIPAISIPLAKHSNGLPFGVQIYANSFEEQKLYDFANYLKNNIISDN